MISTAKNKLNVLLFLHSEEYLTRGNSGKDPSAATDHSQKCERMSVVFYVCPHDGRIFSGSNMEIFEKNCVPFKTMFDLERSRRIVL